MKRLFTTLAVIGMLLLSCKKKDAAPPTLPTLTTTSVSNLTGTTAQSGGTITGNGGADITASGVCWSKTNNTPTITDDTTKGTTASGSFTAMLKNLEPSATYYVRAYATNSAGTGYGNVVTFNTGNAAPQARNLIIEGQAAITNKIKASYTYYDFENDPPATADFQWYIASDTSGGATGTAISGALDSTYMIVAGDQNKFLRVSITPKATAGTSMGAATNSWWVGPVGPEPTSVTFTYNGASVTYGIITSPITGKKWLDRNIGATRVATASDDYLAYGDLFQWGRPADGHQLIAWSSSTTGTAVNGSTDNLATSDIPGHNLYINVSAQPSDWRDDNNLNRWNTNPQGPCPFGWHVPTEAEWRADASGIINAADLYNRLKLTTAGIRITQGIFVVGSQGYYWGSSSKKFGIDVAQFDGIFQQNGGSVGYSQTAYQGKSVRCIKD
jgi:hypothetical protein